VTDPRTEALGSTDVAGRAIEVRRPAQGTAGSRGIVAPGVLLGMGLGGFVDGIVLHQLLQWHHMLSSTGRYGSGSLADLEANVVADGLFHVASWLFVCLGLTLLWRLSRTAERTWGPRALPGWMLVGWGVFNLVEGVVNHHLLRIHHVRDAVAEPLPYDLAFLASGVVLVVGGWLLQRSDSGREAGEGRRRLPE